MSRQMNSRGNGGNVARGAGFAAAKGAALIFLAVVIGIVLLQVVDDGSSGPVAGGTTDDTEETSDTTTPPETTGEDGDDVVDDPADAVPEQTPAELSVLVLNGGAAGGSARTMSDQLSQAGYTNQGEPADWPGREQSGNVVLCRADFQREATALAVAVGDATPTDAFPDAEPPPGSDAFDCVVVVGAAA